MVDAARVDGATIAAGVRTNDLRRAHRVSKSLALGTVWINTYRNVSSIALFVTG